MKIPALVAQFPISLSIHQNMESLLEILEQSKPGDIVLFPEGSVSGYSHDLSFLDQIDITELDEALEYLKSEAQTRQIYLWVGAIIRENGKWFNRAYGFTPTAETHIYDKINLAHHERGIITAGNKLPVFTQMTPKDSLKIGVQICREIRYAEQWGWLVRQGAQIILHLNNAIGNAQQLPVWRSHLVSHAAGNQRFVLSANNAAEEQVAPTMAIAPSGEILNEIIAPKQGFFRMKLDLSQVSDWYLNQCRDDVVTITSPQR